MKLNREMARALELDIQAAENRGAKAAMTVLLEKIILYSSDDGLIIYGIEGNTIGTTELANLVRAELGRD